jgi:hypothetical protein
MKSDAARQMLRIVVITLWSIVLYIPLIRILAPASFKELMNRLSGFIRAKTERMMVSAAAAPATASGSAGAAVSVQQN